MKKVKKRIQKVKKQRAFKDAYLQAVFKQYHRRAMRKFCKYLRKYEKEIY